MSPSNEKNYLFYSGIRLYSLFSVVASVVLVLFACVLWGLTMAANKEDTLAFLVFSLAWSSFAVICCVSCINTIRDLYTKFICHETKITVFWRGSKHEFDLKHPFFVTKMVVRFYIGKAGVDYQYLIFSRAPIDKDVIDHHGMKAVEILLNDGGMLLPLHSETWLKNITNTHEIQAYPKTMYFQGLSKRQGR